MSTRCYLWIDHTGAYAGNSGVQRVVRSAGAALQEIDVDVIPVAWCAEREAIIHAPVDCLELLARYNGPRFTPSSDTGRPLHLAVDADLLRDGWLLFGEVPHVAGDGGPPPALVFDYARYYGLRIATIFYDLIPLRIAGYEAGARRHARYVEAIASSDIIFPISRSSGDDLIEWLQERGWSAGRLPRIVPLLLPQELRGFDRVVEPNPWTSGPLRVVLLGSIEPRKNQLAFLRAARRVQELRPDLMLEIHLIGHLHGAVAVPIKAAAAAVGATLHGFLPDADARALLLAGHLTSFVSLSEGYGLPIAESLWFGRPCLASGFGSMAEVAEGGGCLLVDSTHDDAIVDGLLSFTGNATLRARLEEEATTRPLTTWSDYATRLRSALIAAPAINRIILIQPMDGEGELAARFRDVGVHVSRLGWRADNGALLPLDEAAQPLAPGWAVVDMLDWMNEKDMLAAVQLGEALGFHVAAVLGRDIASLAALISTRALLLFTDAAAHDEALASARRLPRTIGIEQRLLVGGDTPSMLRALARTRRRSSAMQVSTDVPRRLFYWCGLTADQGFNTGIQRVVRCLARGLQALNVEVIPVKWDERLSAMRVLNAMERAALAGWNGPDATQLGTELPERLDGEWLIIPEITIPVVPHGLNAARYGRALGMRTAAIFYDLIPLKQPQHYPPAALDNVRAYLDLFADVDVALPISWTVAVDLVRHLEGRGLTLPKVRPSPLAGELPGTARVTRPQAPDGEGDRVLRLIAVGTLEPRKNYPRLLDGLLLAQQRGASATLTIVGRPAGYDDEERAIESRMAAMAGVERVEHVDDAALMALYERHDMSIYASPEEGFGLPVLESLWRGLPCICHNGSSLAEIGPGGGTVMVDMTDAEAIATAILLLAASPGERRRLTDEALTRPIKSWRDYAETILGELAATEARGWSLPAITTQGRRPLLSCGITTYNRVGWLRHSLPRLLAAARPWRDIVEVVVCDNASTDGTAELLEQHAAEPGLRIIRNSHNVGMLGNLGITARAASGAFIWLLGDDDFVLDGAIESILEGIARHPEIEMAYLNYSYTSLPAPDTINDATNIVATATPVAVGGANRFVTSLSKVAALNENLFTAIYACVFRRDHALRAYQQDMTGAPFSSLMTCVPSSVYALEWLMDRPAWWVGKPAVVVNMNVSWLRWALLWHLERMPDLFELAELRGADADALEVYRSNHCAEAPSWLAAALSSHDDAIRTAVSASRLLQRTKHLTRMRNHLPALKTAYADAWHAGRVAADPLDPDRLFAAFGLQ